MRIFLLLILFVSLGWGAPHTQIILEGDAVLPSEARPPLPQIRIMPPAPVPLEPQEAPVNIKQGYVSRRSRNAAPIGLPEAIPLASPDAPSVVPMTVNPLDRYAASVLSAQSEDHEYRVLSMPLNDFGVAMARRAGLRYIYNPAVRGVVKGVFKNVDPIHMLRVAAKSNGYRLVIKDGINAEFQKESAP
ncbi:MAG: hypothetical protein ACOY3I_02170 [Verrucomicrobiota bacterium]